MNPVRPMKKGDHTAKGAFILIYGQPDVGKSLNSLKYLLGNTIYITTEPRNPYIPLQASERDIDKFPVANVRYSDFQKDEKGKVLDNDQHFESFKRWLLTYEFPEDIVIFDSFSYLINIGLSEAIEDETFDAMKDADKTSKTLIKQTKKEFEGWGALAGQGFRLLSPLARLSERGKIVVVTTLHDANPSWGLMHNNAPLLDGKKLPSNIAGFFDLIGHMYPRTEIVKEEGKVDRKQTVYPPMISFTGMPQTYSKWTGTPPDHGMLYGPFDKMIEYILEQRGVKNESKKQ